MKSRGERGGKRRQGGEEEDGEGRRPCEENIFYFQASSFPSLTYHFKALLEFLLWSLEIWNQFLYVISFCRVGQQEWTLGTPSMLIESEILIYFGPQTSHISQSKISLIVGTGKDGQSMWWSHCASMDYY